MRRRHTPTVAGQLRTLAVTARFAGAAPRALAALAAAPIRPRPPAQPRPPRAPAPPPWPPTTATCGWAPTSVLEEYQKSFGDSWRTATEDAAQPWQYLDDALIKYQDPAEADKVLKIQRDLDETRIILITQDHRQCAAERRAVGQSSSEEFRSERCFTGREVVLGLLQYASLQIHVACSNSTNLNGPCASFN